MVQSKKVNVCLVCNFELLLPVYTGLSSPVGLYSDERFPGRVLVVLDRHEENFGDLSSEVMTKFMQDVQAVSRALMKLPGVVRTNIAILGNAVPHVHAHVIPRYQKDPLPSQSPWDDPRPRVPLSKELEDSYRLLLTELVK